MIFARKDGNHTTYLVTWRKCCWLFHYVITIVLSYVIASEQHQQHIENDAFRTPWIPKHFLEDYSFNTLDGTCPKGGECQRQPGTQCLFLDDVMKHEICNGSDLNKEMLMVNVYPRFCVDFKLDRVLNEADQYVVLNRTEDCLSVLDNVIRVDLKAKRISCEFEDVLGRYDCSEGYSVSWNCTSCVKAYRAWVCSMLFPVYYGQQLVKPCRSFCHMVEQRCPYFHPFIKEQYAGEPAFKCIDRNIPDIPSITPNSAYGQPDNCYRPCQLNSDLEPEPPDAATACQMSSLPKVLQASGNQTGTATTTIKLNSHSAASRASIRPAAILASMLLWWALGFRLYRTPGRTKLYLWREPT